MDMKTPKFLAGFVLGLIATIAAVWYLNMLLVPVVFIALGAFIIGFQLPDVLDEFETFSHTVFLPVALLAVGVVGVWMVSQNQPLEVIKGTFLLPLFVAAIIGNVSHFVAHLFAGEPLALMGAESKQSKKTKKD